MSGTTPAVSTVSNERTKLRANAFDRASTACFAIGIVGPLATALSTGNAAAGLLPLVVGTTTWASATLALHLLAVHTLRRLK